MMRKGESKEGESTRERQPQTERKGDFSDRSIMNAIQLQRACEGQEDPPCPRSPKSLIWNQLLKPNIHFDTITEQ